MNSRKLPTMLILFVMLILGAMFWIDLNYYTDPVTGFLNRGSMWFRYALLIVPLVMSVFGIRTVGAHSVGLLRKRSKLLGSLFATAGGVGALYGVFMIMDSISPVKLFNLILGFMYIWYGVWMALASMQLFVQSSPSPTNSAIWGALVILPFCLTAISRVLINPTSLYRIGPSVRCFSALFIVLWIGTMLRAFYIALTRQRVRWLYAFGIFAFFCSVCIELSFGIYSFMLGKINFVGLFEAICMAATGLLAGVLSVEIGGSAPAKANVNKYV